MGRSTIITEQKLRRIEIHRDPRSRSGLVVDGDCRVNGFVSSGIICGNDDMGWFFEAYDFSASDVLYPTYDAAKDALVEYFWLLKDRGEG